MTWELIMLLCLQTGWTIAVDVVIGPQDGICYRAEQGSLVSGKDERFGCDMKKCWVMVH